MFFQIFLFLFFITNTKGENFCVDCKFYKSSFSGSYFAKCTAFPINSFEDKGQQINYLVSGKRKKVEYRFCSSARIDDNECGFKGRYFQKRDDPFISFICTSKKNEKKEEY